MANISEGQIVDHTTSLEENETIEGNETIEWKEEKYLEDDLTVQNEYIIENDNPETTFLTPLEDYQPSPKTFSGETLTEFIEKLRQLRLLWNTKHKFYHNKYQRNIAYIALLKILRKHMPEATLCTVKSHINSLRTNYRKELNRYLDSRVVVGGKEMFMYQPRNWKFTALQFLDDSNKILDDDEETMDESEMEADSSQQDLDMTKEIPKYKASNQDSSVYFSLPKHLLVEFIQTFKALRLLWDPKHPDSLSKNKKKCAYDKLLEIVRKRTPNATHATVKGQINSLRTNYRKERRRQLDSRIVVKGKEKFLYTPQNWRFHAMKFLHESSDSDQQIANDDQQMANDDQQIANDDQQMANDDQQIANNDSDDSFEADETLYTESEPDFTAHHDSFPRPQPDKNKRIKLESEFGEDASMYLEIPSETSLEEYKAVAMNMAYKLQRMDEEQRYHAELLMHKVLLNGLRGNLTDDTDLKGVGESSRSNSDRISMKIEEQ